MHKFCAAFAFACCIHSGRLVGTQCQFFSLPTTADHSVVGSTAMSDEEEKPKFDDTQINLKVKDQASGNTTLSLGRSAPASARLAAACLAAHLGCVVAPTAAHVCGRAPGCPSPAKLDAGLLTPRPSQDGTEVHFKVKKNTKFSKARTRARGLPPPCWHWPAGAREGTDKRAAHVLRHAAPDLRRLLQQEEPRQGPVALPAGRRAHQR
jgi:hypothetical protein